MNNRSALLIVSFVAALLVTSFAGAEQQLIQNEHEAKWSDAPAMLPPGAKIDVVQGDPGGTALYTARLKFPANYKIPAHSHPTDEQVTVLSGTLYTGMTSDLERRVWEHRQGLVPSFTSRYKINRLGGRSKQEKWILQAELYNEIHRWVKQAWTRIQSEGTDKRTAGRYYRMLRDFLKASMQVWGEAWGNPGYMVTKPVTLKAMVRVCADLTAEDEGPEEDRTDRWRQRLAPWFEELRAFRNEGFYERFPAKGQVERKVPPKWPARRLAGLVEALHWIPYWSTRSVRPPSRVSRLS